MYNLLLYSIILVIVIWTMDGINMNEDGILSITTILYVNNNGAHGSFIKESRNFQRFSAKHIGSEYKLGIFLEFAVRDKRTERK